MSSLEELLSRVKQNGGKDEEFFSRSTQNGEKDEELVVDVRRFLLDNLYKQRFNVKSKKTNALNKIKTTYSDLNGRDDEAFYAEQEKYLELIKFYISQTDDYMLAKNAIYAYLLDEQSIQVKTLGLHLLNVYLKSSKNSIFKGDTEFYENIVPTIEQFFFYIPPHFAISISFPLIKELFEAFNTAIANETSFSKQQNMVLVVYSENVISTMIPALLLTKSENITMLNYILEQLKSHYINADHKYFVNIRRVLHAFKPLKMYPEYLKNLNIQTLRYIFDIIKILPLYDNNDEFYKYDLIIFYLLFNKHTADKIITESDKKEFFNNLKKAYSNIDIDLKEISDKT